MVDALDLPDAAGAGVERRQLGLPARRIGGDLDDAVVDHMGVDDTAAAAIVAAGTGDDGFAGTARTPWLLIDGLIRHGPHLASASIAHSQLSELAHMPRHHRLAPLRRAFQAVGGAGKACRDQSDCRCRYLLLMGGCGGRRLIPARARRSGTAPSASVPAIGTDIA